MDPPPASPPVPDGEAELVANVDKICGLLRAKDDTQRFVGLALLKSVLDNSPELRRRDAVLRVLWDGVPVKFLDRLLLTGSNPSNDNAKEMLDIAVSVVHTFAALLPAPLTAQPRMTGRIPGLVAAVLHSSDATTELILQLLVSLASCPEGARVLVGVQDLSPLTEIAPAHEPVLHVFNFAWLNAMAGSGDRDALCCSIDETMQSLTSAFTGTDAVTLLGFLASFLRQADPAALSTKPKWLKKVVGYIQALVTARPSSEARSAYTNAAASLLQAYPLTAPGLLFSAGEATDKPAVYLLITLILIDIRSSAPTLLAQLNTPEYSSVSRRLASAFDVICIFIGHLVRALEDDSFDGLFMSPDSLLKIRKAISDTMSVTIEHLRDRWDASVAGAMGLHPDARPANAETATGSHRTLTWDSMADAADEDPFILSAVRALALWLREDENELLRKEATGLTDMFMDLYQTSAAGKLDFRSPVLVALEALVELDRGRELLLSHHGWQILSLDLTDMIRDTSPTADASRGTEIVRLLLQVAEQEPHGTAEQWMDLVTTVAAWNIPTQKQPLDVQEFQVAVLQLSSTLLTRAGWGMQTRYRHSINAIRGIATQLSREIPRDSFVREALDDVSECLGGLAT